MAEAGTILPPLHERPIKKTLCLFDVDGPLTLPRQHISPAMQQLLAQLRHQVAIGFVGGSDLAKAQEQLGSAQLPVTSLFDYSFAENGLTAFRLGVALPSTSFIDWLGEERYAALVNWTLRYVAGLAIPVKRGTFVEFRNGMVNISPIGRNASLAERNAFEQYDAEHGVRKAMVAALRAEFPDFGLTCSIGGQISFDVFPNGWDKTFCLRHVAAEKDRDAGADFTTIHFFGDKTYPGGNDYEIFSHPTVTGHTVQNPDETMVELKKLFSLS